MKFHEIRILADENVSPKVTAFLRIQGLDVLDVKEQGWQGKIDDELLEIAYHDKRWILTHDSDFGTLAIHEGKQCYGIIFLRLRNHRSHNVIRVCGQLLNHHAEISPRTMVVVEEARIRIRHVNIN